MCEQTIHLHQNARTTRLEFMESSNSFFAVRTVSLGAIWASWELWSWMKLRKGSKSLENMQTVWNLFLPPSFQPHKLSGLFLRQTDKTFQWEWFLPWEEKGFPSLKETSKKKARSSACWNKRLKGLVGLMLVVWTIFAYNNRFINRIV